MTYYEQFQLEHYGNILNEPEPEDYDEAAAFEAWMRNGEESLLIEMENNYPL